MKLRVLSYSASLQFLPHLSIISLIFSLDVPTLSATSLFCSLVIIDFTRRTLRKFKELKKENSKEYRRVIELLTEID